MKERWKDVEGSGGVYEVSTKGRVRTRAAKVSCVNVNRWTYKPHLHKGMKCGQGRKYVQVELGMGIGLRYVHHLMAEAFLGWKPGCGLKVSFANNDPSDMRIENIRTVTQGQLNREWRRRKREAASV